MSTLFSDACDKNPIVILQRVKSVSSRVGYWIYGVKYMDITRSVMYGTRYSPLSAVSQELKIEKISRHKRRDQGPSVL